MQTVEITKLENNVFSCDGGEKFGKIRVVLLKGTPWLVAKDVCDYLELKNSRKACSSLDEDEKADVTISYTSLSGVTQGRSVTVISESGFYALVMRSRKPNAVAFRKWITCEVIPQLIRTGEYSVKKRKSYGKSWDDINISNVDNSKYEEFLALPADIRCRLELDVMSKILSVAEVDKNSIAISMARLANEYIGRNMLKEANIELVAKDQEHCLTPTQIGERYGLSGQRINRILEREGYQENICGNWEMTKKGKKFGKIVDTGKKQGTGTPVTQLKWLSSILKILDSILEIDD